MKMKKITAHEYEIEKEFPAEYHEPLYEVGDIFRKYGKQYRETHNLDGPRLAAMQAIERCRTTALGAHVDQCDQCGHVEISYNSCRNRNCPKCRGSQRSAWVEARELELLPIQYFHIVFTLPQGLVPLSRYYPEAIYDLLFRIAAETLQAFAERRWGGRVGITMVLHTWGQTLNEHPHVHCIVTGGALKTDESAFVQAPKNFLFPVTALSPVFREKYLTALEGLCKKGRFDLASPAQLSDERDWSELFHTLRAHDWVVYTKPPFDGPQYLIRYLGRYVNRIAIANHRIQSIEDGIIAFRYLDYRDYEEKVMELRADSFIDRFLKHIPPRQFRRVRYYGFMVNSLRKAKLILCRKLLGLVDPDKAYIADMDAYLTSRAYDPRQCPHCLMGKLINVFQVLSFHDPPACYLEAATP